MAGQHRALLIGNSVFPEDPHSLQPLNGPINDLMVMRSALEDGRVGLFQPGEVTAWHERTSAELLFQLDDFFSSAMRDDLLLLYYSGHGRLDEFGTLYLCARNTQTDRLRSTAISSRQLDDIINASPATRAVIILDCCYSGAFKGADIAQPVSGDGRYVLTSCRAVELAADAAAPAGSSLFTSLVAEGLRNAPASNGHLTIDALHGYVRRRMIDAGNQRPQFIARGEGGLVIARREQAAAPAQLQPAPTVAAPGSKPPPTTAAPPETEQRSAPAIAKPGAPMPVSKPAATTDLPLASRPPADRSLESSALWAQLAIEPIIVRLPTGTGYSLQASRPSQLFIAAESHEGEVSLFLTSGDRLHLARTPAGLVNLVNSLEEHDMLELDTWEELAAQVQTEDVMPDLHHEYDIAAAVQGLSEGLDSLPPHLPRAAYDFCYGLAVWLPIEDLHPILGPNSLLHTFHEIVIDLDNAGFGRWSAKRRASRLDLVEVYDAWTLVADRVADVVAWHD